MGWFSPRRNPQDPHQLRIAVHELGHAAVWADAGLTITEIVHSGDDGHCSVEWDPNNLAGYAIGCWGGFEAEDRWLRHHRRGHASRGNAGYDIRNFRHVSNGLDTRLSEGKARSLARAAVGRHWDRITTLAPRLITTGRLTTIRL
ncbi:hypothetical protein VSH64_36990 [Amycolatopsis rhabdoformis]|uniref:Uncharacterized protein n=1 Tax=Amycolatopsis rhabdoformis TaxID=1448059 RepID=A0ABZ1I1X7_9PSEU|nr:hypothetical protein [Amycolatopsis rhabdoformis]WSE28392.1 hypothetical protein VSH64_36990 [Amycolatopsis rhabdoformis]